MTDYASTDGFRPDPSSSAGPEHPHTVHSHGNTPAAWTAVGIMILGTLICAVSFPLVAPWLFFVGLVVVALGLVVGKLMSMAGLGSLPSYTVEEPFPTVFEGATMTDGERQDVG